MVIVVHHGGVQEVGDKLGEAGSPESLACQVGRVGQRKNVCCIEFEKPVIQSGELKLVPEGGHKSLEWVADNRKADCGNVKQMS